MNMRATNLILAALAALALAGCTSKPEARPMDEPMRIARDSAAAYYADGRFAAAEVEYERALARAYVLDNGQAAARYRYQIAVCKLGLGKLDEARASFSAASREAVKEGAFLLAAQAETAEARVALEQGKAAEAKSLAAQALKRPRTANPLDEPDFRLRADAHLVLAEAAATDDGKRARAELAEARKEWGKTQPEPVFEAVAARVEGLILAGEPGKTQDAAKAFEREGEQWQAARRYRERASALERAAIQTETLPKEGPIKAAALYLKAARIRYGLGQREEARKLAAQAARLAEQGGRGDLVELARLLQEKAP